MSVEGRRALDERLGVQDGVESSVDPDMPRGGRCPASREDLRGDEEGRALERSGEPHHVPGGSGLGVRVLEERGQVDHRDRAAAPFRETQNRWRGQWHGLDGPGRRDVRDRLQGDGVGRSADLEVEELHFSRAA